MSYKLWGSCLAIHKMISIYFPREALINARATETLFVFRWSYLCLEEDGDELTEETGEAFS